MLKGKPSGFLMKAIIFVGLALFKASLDFVYRNCISISYAYWGFDFDPKLANSLISWLVFIVLSLFLVASYKPEPRPSWLLVFALFQLSFSPACVLFEKANLSLDFFILLSIYWLLIIGLQSFIPIIADPQSQLSRREGPTILTKAGDLITTLFAAYVLIQKFRFNGTYVQLSLESVYELRLAARNFNFGPYANYLFTWASMIFTVRAITAIASRKWALFLVLCFCQLMLFSIDGQKAVIFSIPMSVIGFAILKRASRIRLVPYALGAMNLIAMMVYSFIGNIWLVGLYSFRILFVPALINYQFFDFFSRNPPDMLAQSVFRRFGAVSRYQLPIPFMIGQEYYGEFASANTGMLGDAFSNFGAAGAFIYPIMFVLTLKMFDMASMKMRIRELVAIVVIYSMAFSNGAFFTVLLSNGFLIALFFVQTQSSKPSSSRRGSRISRIFRSLDDGSRLSPTGAIERNGPGGRGATAGLDG